MTVAELIKQLQQFEPDTQVYVTTDAYGERAKAVASVGWEAAPNDGADEDENRPTEPGVLIWAE